MEDQILRLLHERVEQGLDQGLLAAEIAEGMGTDQNSVLAALHKLEVNSLAYKESFWWYPGPAPDHTVEIDQM
jgi:DNA-binding IclR family transcriptional regulator